jgi:hypothetical protein
MPELENRVFYGVLGVIFQILAGFPVYADWIRFDEYLVGSQKGNPWRGAG